MKGWPASRATRTGRRCRRCWANPNPHPNPNPNPNPNHSPSPNLTLSQTLPLTLTLTLTLNQVLPLLGAPTVVEAGDEVAVQFTMALDDDIGVPPAYGITATVS